MPADITLSEQLAAIEAAIATLSAAETPEALEATRLSLLGRKGLFADLGPQLARLDPTERPTMGKRVNMLRQQAEALVVERQATLSAGAIRQTGKSIFDPTLPGRPPVSAVGRLHPFTKTLERLLEIFCSMGFEVVEGPEIETEYYNFEALNLGADHPARDSQDSFYLDVEGGLLLRTQTSPVQLRAMESRKPPLMVVAPGRVFRRDAFTARHSPVFHQIEGLMIDKGLTFAHLKGVLAMVARELYGADRKIRMRPDYFPFTEPSGDLAIDCAVCQGIGCRVCSHSGWVELLGAGMVHPQVLRNGGIDPAVYTGFAFGMGIDRLAMMASGINDIRLLTENDVRFLDQF